MPTSPRKSAAPKIIAVLVLVAAAVAAGYWAFQQQHAAREYNRVLNSYVNQDKYEEGAAEFEKMLPDAPGNFRLRIKAQIAECYRRLGNQPERPLKDQAQWLRKAKEADPSISYTTEEQRVVQVGTR